MTDLHPAALAWRGNTLAPDYSRDAELTKPQGLAAIPVSSLPAFGGSAERWNPEELLAGTLAHCHMLTFLALAAKARLEVRDYQDRAEARMVTENRVSRVAEIRLQPLIRVGPGTDPGKVRELFEKAHTYCVIANSITSAVVMAPEVVEG